jgi:hypothetical protein
MAVPSYTEDLTDIDLAEGSTTGYLQINFAGGGGGTLGFGPDFSMQGTDCIDRQVTSNERGIQFNNATTITIPTGDHIFVWGFVATPGLTDLLVNRGAFVILGDAAAVNVQYHVEGSDTYGASGRVAKCYPIDYSVRTSNTGSIPYRTVNGTPGAAPQYFGFGVNITGTVKGANIGLDAQRYGTGAYITAGDVTTPATFAGFATQSDAVTNRWGILTDVGGSLELQGYFVVGQNNAGTATLAYFEDSDVSIVTADTVHAAADFTRFIFDHASTVVKWTNINVTALGTINPGYLEVLNSSTVFTLVGGTFSGFGKTTLNAACTATGTTWRSSGQITMAAATLTLCNIELSTNASAVLCNSKLEDIDLCNFIGDGTGHAIELTSLGTGTMAWDNTFDITTYASVDGSTGNETIYVNVGSGTLTINVASGATTPSIRTAGATVTVVSGQLMTTVNVKRLDTGANLLNANVLLYAADSSGDLPFEDVVTITRSGTVATVAHTAHGIPDGKKVRITKCNQQDYSGVHVITVTGVNSYTYTVANSPTTPATGTILATGVVVEGLTDASGNVADTRAWVTSTPVTGWARKSTSSPFFQQGALGGTVGIVANTDINVQLTSDE